MSIVAHNIHKTFDLADPITVLKGVNLTVAKGETIAIMGKSGEGKSTLLHILGTLEKPTSGDLLICGKSTHSAKLPQLRNTHLGFIFQSCHLLEEDTLLNNVLMPAYIARQPIHQKSDAHVRAIQLLEALGLMSRAQCLAKVLSGGEAQRGAVARAFCNDPDIILADEPTGNLDRANSTAIHTLLMQLTKERGKTLIVVTHDEELASLCDHIYVLKSGVLSLK